MVQRTRRTVIKEKKKKKLVRLSGLIRGRAARLKRNRAKKVLRVVVVFVLYIQYTLINCLKFFYHARLVIGVTIHELCSGQCTTSRAKKSDQDV